MKLVPDNDAKDLSNAFGSLRIWAAVFAIATAGFVFIVWAGSAVAKDLDGRFAGSALKPWFDKLHSSKGLCCSDADGSAVSNVDWQTSNGHYQVRLDGRWIDVPDDAVVTVPNLAGKAMVWPVYYNAAPMIRCFMPGPLT